MRRLAIALAAAVLLAACAHRARTWQPYCEQALKAGWCSDRCEGRQQPIRCQSWRLVGAGDGLCVYQSQDGSLAFAACGGGAR